MKLHQQMMMTVLLSAMCSYSSATSPKRLQTHKGTMYIIGRYRTEKFTVTGRVLNHVSSTVHYSSFAGCAMCAYAQHDQDMYMAGDSFTRHVHTQTSILTADGTVTAQPDLPTLGKRGPFSFILNGRQYVGGLESNEVYSRTLSMGSWVREVNLPGSMCFTARSGVVSQGVVYITGGNFDDSASNAAWSWSPGQPVWHQLPSMKHSYTYHCNVLVNSDIFVLGGLYRDTVYVEMYNLHSQMWSQRSPVPYDYDEMHIGSCAALGTNIYIHFSDKVFLYDTVEDRWSVLYTMETEMSWGTASAMLIV